MAHAQLLITGVTLTLVPFYVVPELQVAHGGIQGRRTRIDVAERLLHDMQRGALRDYFDIEQLGRTYGRV